jgi:Alpha-L-fucosidase
MKDTKQQWFKDAKYGLFIHWGLYSLLEGEYNGEMTPFNAEWIINHMDVPIEEYEKLAEQFNPVEFNAEEYVLKAKEWGMRYIVFTSKHHDGFAMYHSKCNPYNVVDATPCKRDILKELQIACEKHDMRLGLYYSQAQDWHDPDGYSFGKDNSNKDFGAYLERVCKPQLREILTEYGEISLIWFDTQLTMTEEESRSLRELVKSLQPNCLINGRLGNGLGDYMTTSDNLIPLLPYEGDWEVPATLNNTWGFKKGDENWKNPNEIIKKLLKINGRGGNYLLNIGPTASGHIPEGSIEILDTVGKFVTDNADAIFETKPLAYYPYELEWMLFTRKDYKLFIHILEMPARMHVISLGNTIKKAYFLHSGEEVKYVEELSCENEGCWEFELPESEKGKKNITICVELNEKDMIVEPLFSKA